MPSRPETVADHELLAERAVLEQARSCQRLMRERARSLGAVGGDEYATRMLEGALARRVASLEDDGTTPPFFGRLDREPTTDDDDPDSFHIGRRHIHDEYGDPLVIDWRAGISTAFYRASAVRADGRRAAAALRLRRRPAHRVRGRAAARPGPVAGAGSAILQQEIERPRVGPMRDIVATIQPDQDEIVRAPTCGRPSAYRALRAPARRPSGCTGPRTCCTRTATSCAARACWSSARTALSSATSPRCCRPSARSRSSSAASATWSRASRSPRPTTTRGRPCSARLGWRSCCTGQSGPGSRRPPRPSCCRSAHAAGESDLQPWRAFSTTCVHTARASTRHATCCRCASADHILRAMEGAGDSPDDRVLDAVARSRPVRAAVDALWPKLSAAALVRELFTDPAVLAGRRRGHLHRGRAAAPAVGQAFPLAQGHAAGPWPRSTASTRSPTSSTASRASATSSSTRRRTSPRCSCGPSAVAAPPARQRSSATSPRARRRGQRTRGTRCLRRSASRTPSSRC